MGCGASSDRQEDYVESMAHSMIVETQTTNALLQRTGQSKRCSLTTTGSAEAPSTTMHQAEKDMEPQEEEDDEEEESHYLCNETDPDRYVDVLEFESLSSDMDVDEDELDPPPAENQPNVSHSRSGALFPDIEVAMASWADSVTTAPAMQRSRNRSVSMANGSTSTNTVPATYSPKDCSATAAMMDHVDRCALTKSNSVEHAAGVPKDHLLVDSA